MPIRNISKERLVAGELAIGMGVKALRTVKVARILKTAGFDWLFIDLNTDQIRLHLTTIHA